MRDCSSLADELADRLQTDIAPLPESFFDSFEYTSTGSNLTHPVVLGSLSRFAWGIEGVSVVGIDVHLNRDGIKFQPDIVGYNAALQPLIFLDYESPNSSDARVLPKDVDGFCAWSKHAPGVPYLIITTLPDKPASGWELRWTAKGNYNYGYGGKESRDKLRENPYRFWYDHYVPGFGKRCMNNIAVINISGRRVSRVFPGGVSKPGPTATLV